MTPTAIVVLILMILLFLVAIAFAGLGVFKLVQYLWPDLTTSYVSITVASGGRTLKLFEKDGKQEIRRFTGTTETGGMIASKWTVDDGIDMLTLTFTDAEVLPESKASGTVVFDVKSKTVVMKVGTTVLWTSPYKQDDLKVIKK